MWQKQAAVTTRYLFCSGWNGSGMSVFHFWVFLVAIQGVNNRNTKNKQSRKSCRQWTCVSGSPTVYASKDCSNIYFFVSLHNTEKKHLTRSPDAIGYQVKMPLNCQADDLLGEAGMGFFSASCLLPGAPGNAEGDRVVKRAISLKQGMPWPQVHSMELHETITVCAMICVSHRTWSSVLKGDGTAGECSSMVEAGWELMFFYRTYSHWRSMYLEAGKDRKALVGNLDPGWYKEIDVCLSSSWIFIVSNNNEGNFYHDIYHNNITTAGLCGLGTGFSTKTISDACDGWDQGKILLNLLLPNKKELI